MAPLPPVKDAGLPHDKWDASKYPNVEHFDVVVIGSGSGSKITRPAAGMGFKTAIIEKGPYGGTCLNRGCIPSKMLIHPADVLQEVRHAAKFDINGIDAEKIWTDRRKLVERVSAAIDADSNSIAPLYAKTANLSTFHGYAARFVANKLIELTKPGSETRYITGDRIFVPAGCRAHIPNVPGLKGTPFLTYQEVLRYTEPLESCIVVGGGYIATELSHYLAQTGTKITVLVRSQMIRAEDEEVITEFERVFSSKYPCHFGVHPTRVSFDEATHTFTVEIENVKTKERQTLQAKGLFIATGVVPNTDELGIKENTDMVLDKAGFLKVDDHFQTAVPGVYAWGDIIGRYLFRHSANFEGEYVFDHVFKGHAAPVSYPPVPHAIFSNPQVGGVGLTTQEARMMGMDVIIGKAGYRSTAMGDALLSEEGFAKLLFEKTTKRLVGAHIIGAEASDMIHLCISYLYFGATLDDILRFIYIHPALPEVVRNAARNARATYEKLAAEPVPPPAANPQPTL
ncbi:pyridine nucleotide-disulfide oxidoreductase [Hyaloraphidium curvatum]|nr:pyridine nucleotide-disulfide oxidoreductase [Hyaloraphidium curvatum]